jgi:hypothetical protein
MDVKEGDQLRKGGDWLGRPHRMSEKDHLFFDVFKNGKDGGSDVLFAGNEVGEAVYALAAASLSPGAKDYADYADYGFCALGALCAVYAECSV